MSTQDPEEREALRAEIQAAIAAGRELDPDMDKHLADSALERYERERAARARALSRPTQPAPTPARGPTPGVPGAPAAGSEVIARAVMTVAGIAAFVAIVIWQPHLWWLFFFLPMIAGWWGWGGWGRHWRRYDGDYLGSRRDLRIARRQERIRRLQSGGSGPIEYD